MAKLLYQGHGSYRITAADGRVIYVDPFAGEGYDAPADFVFITHQHDDHNKLERVTKKPGCRIITEKEALAGGKHNSFSLDGIEVEAVTAQNKNHNPEACVGYIITLDGVTIYASGDTSKTAQMETFAPRNFDFALYCCDGLYNMSLEEAAECARIVGARHNIPIHVKPGQLFDRALAETWDAPNRVIVEPGEEINLQ